MFWIPSVYLVPFLHPLKMTMNQIFEGFVLKNHLRRVFDFNFLQYCEIKDTRRVGLPHDISTQYKAINGFIAFKFFKFS